MSSLKIDYSKLEKYLRQQRKHYVEELYLGQSITSEGYANGHIHMIDMLLDDLDSFLAYDIISVDIANDSNFVRKGGYQPKTGNATPPNPPKSGSNVVKGS